MFPYEEPFKKTDDRDLDNFELGRTYKPQTDCLIEQFFREQANRPANQRSSSCLISCPCRRCNPYTTSAIATLSSGAE